MARLRQRSDSKSGIWILDYRDVDGKRYQVSTGTTDEDTAKKFLTRYEERMAQVKLGLLDRIGKITAAFDELRAEAKEQRQKTMTMLEFRDLYLDRAEHELRQAKNTRVIFKSAADRFIDFIGDKLITDVTPEDVLAFKKKLRTKTYTTPTKKVKTRTNTTESMYVRSLRTAFNRAVKWEYIEKNPFNSVEVPTYRETRRRNKDMSIQEVRQLLQTIDAAGKVQFAQYVRCVLYTGGRRNELLFVRGEDVDMEKRVLTVTVTKRKGGPVRLKIPINDALYNVLRTMEIKRGQYLFKTDNNSRGARDKGKAWHPSYVTDEFKKMVTKAGLPDHYSLHSLRHTYVTYLREKGVPIDVIQRLLGHTSSKMTWETYDHTEALSFRQYANLVKFEDEDDAAT